MSDAVEAAWTALEDGLPEEALALLADAPESAPRWACAALCFLDLGAYDEADRAAARAEAADPGDPDVLLASGEVHLAAWRIERARSAFERLAECAPSREGWERLALCLDLLGEEEAADRALTRAAEEDPEGGPRAPRLDPAAFEAVVVQAVDDLPPQFQAALEHVAIVIDPVPGIGAVVGDGRETPPDLLGLFVGTSLVEQSTESSGQLPPTVYLFQRNLERGVADEGELVQEIRVTLYHELGHALGFDEEGVEDMGLG